MTTNEQPDLGTRLKELRKEKGITLNDLARLTGMSRSTLYKVENNGMSLTYQKLLRLSDGLGVEIAELFRVAPKAPPDALATAFREVGRAGEGDLVATPNYDHYYLCNEIVHKGLVPMLGRVKRSSIRDFGEMSTHPGEEFTYVVEGTIEVHTQVYRPVVLNQGDYIFLSSTMPHAYINAGSGEARILTVCTRPEHGMDPVSFPAFDTVTAAADVAYKPEVRAAPASSKAWKTG
jgi:transcriptional regulator with XRE-family HTH domain